MASAFLLASTTAQGPSAPTNPPSGMVTLLADTGAQLTLMIIGDPDRSGGVGGWQQSERLGRPDSDWFKGRVKAAQSLPCALHLTLSPGPSLERRLRVLYGMGHAGDRAAPPGIRLAGDVPQSKDQTWKLDDIASGTRRFLRDDPDALEYIELTLTLSELNVADEIDDVTISPSRRRKTGTRRKRTYTVRRGDTLRSIAVRELGTSGQWTDLRDANKAKVKRADPDTPLKPGLDLKLP